MNASGIADRGIERITGLSHLPPSMDGNLFLYAWSLASVMIIACLGLSVFAWMVRDTWRDRFRLHPQSLLFMFRVMIGLAGFAAFLRSMPEVLFLQSYGDPDVSTGVQAAIITGKRIADGMAVWPVSGWILILVAIYPPLCVALSSGPARAVVIDIPTTWPRLRRPALLFTCICVVSIFFAYGKVYGR